jgi:protease-4
MRHRRLRVWRKLWSCSAAGANSHIQLREAIRALEARRQGRCDQGTLPDRHVAGPGLWFRLCRAEGSARGDRCVQGVGQAGEGPTSTTRAHREFYLSSVADEIVLDPYGAVGHARLGLTNRCSTTGAFEKFGIGVQVTRVGKYKSAVELFHPQADEPGEPRADPEAARRCVGHAHTPPLKPPASFPPGAIQNAVR